MIPSKLPGFGTSIFTTMSQMAREYGALNLAQGFPDFEVSRTLVDTVYESMLQGKNQYAPSYGVPELQEVIAAMNKDLYGFEANAGEEVSVFTGATEALFASISAIVADGDEVIIFDPAYDSYDPVVRFNKGKPIHINLSFPGFKIPWDEVEGKITAKTKAIIINNPHNPTGSVLAKEDLLVLERLVLKHGLFVISDEVYHNMIFDDRSHQSVLAFPHLRTHAVAIFSFGKTLHATGWKVGYAVAPKAFTDEIRKLHQLLTFSVNTPVQYALASFMQDKTNYALISKFFQSKRDFFLQKLEGSAFEPVKSEGTYFQVLAYDKISSSDDNQMANKLVLEHGIASIPISGFYQDKTDHRMLRFCFAKNEETLSAAAKLLQSI